MDIVSTPSEVVEDSGMDLLRAGVPLSLLLDLGLPGGPDSHDLFINETKPDSVWHRLERPA